MRPLKWLQRNALWLVGFGLMLASSGIDGAYMARWMTALPWGDDFVSAAVLGYVLNTTSDVASMVLSYTFAGIRRNTNRGYKKAKLAWVLLGAEAVAVLYSWFFGWRQLLLVLPSVETSDAVRWVAPVSAGFIPVLLAAIGWAQALIAEPDDASDAEVDAKPAPVKRVAVNQAAKPAPLKPIGVSEWRELVSGMNGDAPDDAEAVRQWLVEHRYEVPSASTLRRWAEEVSE